MGALSAFFISRHWLGRTIRKRCLKNHKTFMAVNAVISDNGWKTVLLLRLTPLPFSVVSYFLGITKVKTRDFLLGNMIEALHISLWLYVGKSLGRFSDINSKAKAT